MEKEEIVELFDQNKDSPLITKFKLLQKMYENRKITKFIAFFNTQTNYLAEIVLIFDEVNEQDQEVEEFTKKYHKTEAILTDDENIEAIQVMYQENSNKIQFLKLITDKSIEFELRWPENDNNLQLINQEIMSSKVGQQLVSIQYQKQKIENQETIIYIQFFFGDKKNKIPNKQKTEKKQQEDKEEEEKLQNNQQIAIVREDLISDIEKNLNKAKNEQLVLKEKQEIILQNYQSQVERLQKHLKQVKTAKSLLPNQSYLEQCSEEYKVLYPKIEKTIDEITYQYNELVNLENDLEILKHTTSNTLKQFQNKSFLIIKNKGLPSEEYYKNEIRYISEQLQKIDIHNAEIKKKRKEIQQQQKDLKITELINNFKNAQTWGDIQSNKKQLNELRENIIKTQQNHTEYRQSHEVIQKQAEAQALNLQSEKLLCESQIKMLEDQINNTNKKIKELQEKKMTQIKENFEEELKEMQEIQKKIKEITEQQLKSQQNMSLQQDERMVEYTKIMQQQLQKISQIKTSKTHFHFVLVLDQSGSMNDGERWNILRDSAQKFHDERKKAIDNQDTITVILFDDSASAAIENTPLNQSDYKFPQSPRGGFTNFEKAFKFASNAVKTTQFEKGYVPIIIFLTDGEGQGDYKQILKQIYQENKEYGYFFLGIGLGQEYKTSQLDEIVKIANGDKDVLDFQGHKFLAKKDCKNPQSLQQVFIEIQKLMNKDIVGLQNLNDVLNKENEKIRDIQIQYQKLQREQQDQLLKDLKAKEVFLKNEVRTDIENRQQFYQEQIKILEKDLIEFQKQLDQKFEQIKQITEKISEKQVIQKNYENLIKQNEELLKKKLQSLENDLEMQQKQIEDQVSKKTNLFQKMGFSELKQYQEFESRLDFLNSLFQQYDLFLTNLIKLLESIKYELNSVKELAEDPTFLTKYENQNSEQMKILLIYRRYGVQIDEINIGKSLFNVFKYLDPKFFNQKKREDQDDDNYDQKYQLAEYFTQNFNIKLKELINYNQDKLDEQADKFVEEFLEYKKIPVARQEKKDLSKLNARLRNLQLEEIDENLSREDKKQIREEKKDLQEQIRDKKQEIKDLQQDLVVPLKRFVLQLLIQLQQSLILVNQQSILTLQYQGIGQACFLIQNTVMPSLEQKSLLAITAEK